VLIRVGGGGLVKDLPGVALSRDPRGALDIRWRRPTAAEQVEVRGQRPKS